jgi:hypothetical protein
MRMKTQLLIVSLMAFANSCIKNESHGLVHEELNLPSILRWDSGQPLESAEKWPERKQQIINTFQNLMYGKVPDKEFQVNYHTLAFDQHITLPESLRNQVISKLISVEIQRGLRKKAFQLMVLIPKVPSGAKVPAILTLNFANNLSIAQGWHTKKSLAAGIAQLSVQYTKIEPDNATSGSGGIRELFLDEGDSPTNDGWGAISAWAFGLSRIIDFVSTIESINSKAIGVFGHSRLGKTALWAAAQDERIAFAISNNSGCGGASLSRKCRKVTVAEMNRQFPHWVANNFFAFSDQVDSLPFDQHMLIAAIAPRPLYIASASEDLWADTDGEFLGAYFGSEAYRFLGEQGIGINSDFPETHQPIGDQVRYHVREGDHGVFPYDWERFLEFIHEKFASTSADGTPQ